MELKENYYALTVAILGNVSPDVAFGRLTGQRYQGRGPKQKDTNNELIVRLRDEGKTLQEIQSATGVSYGTIYRRLQVAQNNN